MTLEAIQITDAILRELRADELAAGVPLGAVRGEDGIAEEGFPLLVEGLALAIVAKLRG